MEDLSIILQESYTRKTIRCKKGMVLMKKKLIKILSVVIVIELILLNVNTISSNNELIFSIKNINENKFANEVITTSCPGSSTCCESGYNVMCHMVEPLKNYAVTSQVCDNRSGYYHKGIDLVRTTSDGNLYAAFEGVVISTTNNDKNCVPSSDTLLCSWLTCSSTMGLSATIRITNDYFNGYTMQYMHMSQMDIKVGDRVTAGQKIGVIGNTGCSTGEHLHFQINNVAGDPIVMNAFFLDKTMYTCGGVIDNTTSAINKIVSDYSDDALKNILTYSDGSPYKAKIGDCLGNDSGEFVQGIELKYNGTGKTAYVRSITGGYVVNQTLEGCGNGITVLSDNGEIHSYCHMADNTLRKSVGNRVNAGDILGIMGQSGDAKETSLLYIVIRNGKYVDLSSKFLIYNGGKCANRNRKNCASISDGTEKYLCQNPIR